MSLEPDPVLLDTTQEGVAVVTLNRPAKRNAFDELMIDALAETFETLRGAEHVRIVFLRGAGEVFCAGADIEWMRRQGERSRADNEADGLSAAHMFHALHQLPQLTVALVKGAATGGGLGLIAAADIAVAMKGAKFRFSEVRLGLIPAMISPYVVTAIGPRWAGALFATAEEFDAAFAEKIGLVHTIVDDEPALEARAEQLTDLVMGAAPGAVAEAKALVRYMTDHHVIDEHTIKETAKRIAARRASDEGKEGLAAFLEKRKPSWAE